MDRAHNQPKRAGEMRVLHVTAHAISRYRERVEPVGYDAAVKRLTTPAILKAAELGGGSVRLPGGQRVIVCGNCVVTVHPRPACHRRRNGRRFIEAED